MANLYVDFTKLFIICLNNFPQFIRRTIKVRVSFRLIKIYANTQQIPANEEKLYVKKDKALEVAFYRYMLYAITPFVPIHGGNMTR